MHKYLFITYGQPGWRGVQMRALRIAKYLGPDNVLFWNMYDSAFLAEQGFSAVTKDPGIVDPDDIVFPEGIESVFFADLPPEEHFEYAVFIAAKKKGLVTIISDQLYKRGQFGQTVYKRFSDLADLTLVNSLSCFASEESDRIKIVPPQIEYAFTPETKKEMRDKYGVPMDSILMFGIGYHPGVYKKIEEITNKLSQSHNNFHTIVVGSINQTEKIIRKGNLISLPFNIGDDYFRLLYAADIAMVKFGFLQILEALALHKPTIVLGEAGYVLRNPDAIDVLFKKNLLIEQEISEKTIQYLEKLITDEAYRQQVISNISKLHDGGLFGAKKGAELIRTARLRVDAPLPNKKVAILFNNEVFEKQEWLKTQENIYPLCLFTAMQTDPVIVKRLPPEALQHTLKELQIPRTGEILPHSFKEAHVLSDRKLDGFTDMYSWYGTWVKHLTTILLEADDIYITKQGLFVLDSLIKSHSLTSKITIL